MNAAIEDSLRRLHRTFGPLVARIRAECKQKGGQSPANRADFALISAAEDLRFGDDVVVVERRLSAALQDICAEQGIGHS